MNFNTVIFYDIENLLGGYGSRNAINELSLKDVLDIVKDDTNIDKIASQKAYANWSDPRLKSMQGEINLLGIDPIQVYGFSKYQKKNAADIQLSVDAIDLANTRPDIKVFVIVSGDGGFAAVAKKLHEYGKYVIGCAYDDSTNKIFKSVCDSFIIIEKFEENEYEYSNNNNNNNIRNEPTNPDVIQMTKKIEKLEEKDYYKSDKIDKEIIKLKSREIINYFGEIVKSKLNQVLNISILREGFKYTIEDFKPELINILKFSNFLQYICNNNNFREENFREENHSLLRELDTSNDLFILRKNSASFLGYGDVNKYNSYEKFPELGGDFIHSYPHYLEILSTSSISPRITFDSFSDMLSVNEAVSNLKYPIEGNELADKISEFIHDKINVSDEIPPRDINRMILTLINLNILEKENSEVMINEQKISLKDEYVENPQKITDKVITESKNKLIGFFGEKEINHEILESIFRI